ncbi:MAG: ATP-binding protein [bacterium]
MKGKQGKKLSFQIKSDLNLIPEIVKEMIEAASEIIEDRYMFEVAVCEAIYNAIEHGNLEITRSRKEKMMAQGTYDDFLKDRFSRDACANKKVVITLKYNREKLQVEVTDEGNGFNWKEELAAAKIFANQDLSQFNGYGLKIILSVFDEVFYNKKGNLLTMIKLKKTKEGKN